MPEHRRLPDLPMGERLNDDGTAGDRAVLPYCHHGPALPTFGKPCLLRCRSWQNFQQYSWRDIWKIANGCTCLKRPQVRTLFPCAASVTGEGEMALSGSPTVR